VDGVTAADFKAKLKDNITALQVDLRADRYVFQRLRLAPVPKPSGGFRIIAVPTIRDRLLQRCLLRYLEDDRRFSASSEVSYGFTKGRTLRDAQRAALKLRESHPWVLQADIIKFFDYIPRAEVKALARAKIRSKFVSDLVCKAIDCELEKGSGRNVGLPELNGIQAGRGLRQGMPLSPMLSNLLLRHFDDDLQRSGLHIIRYADDIAVFADSKHQCQDALKLMQDTLAGLGLKIPDLDENGKTKVSEPTNPSAFLGVEIKRGEKGYILCAPAGRLAEIEAEMSRLATVKACLENRRDLGRLLRTLDSFIVGHHAAMMVLDDAGAFLDRLEAAKRRCIEKLLSEMLGSEAVRHLDEKRSAVLGLSPFPEISQRRPQRRIGRTFTA
jgi:hypothetical protein